MSPPPEPTRDKIGRTVTRATWAIIIGALLAAVAALGLLVAALIVGRS
ncbi:hypothetical protein [Dactylosporangium sp. CA-139066]